MILGIDPGLSGALAFYQPSYSVNGVSQVSRLVIVDVPTYGISVKKINKKGKQVEMVRKVLDLCTLAALVRDNTWPVACQAVIEDVHSMPKQGVASSFKFGFVAGAIQATVTTHSIPMTLVQSYAWKRHFKLTSDKDSSRKRASELLPQFAHLWARAKDHGRAEAALIALYGHTVLNLT